MKRRTLIFILIAVAAIVAAAVTAVVIIKQDKAQIEPTTNTNAIGAIEVIPDFSADLRFVGVWQNTAHPQEYLAFYDDLCEDAADFFWGKTWDEADDVFEEDLTFHGNGWFRWHIQLTDKRTDAVLGTTTMPLDKTTTNRHLREKLVQIHCTDRKNFDVPKYHEVLSIKDSTLILTDNLNSSRTTYKRVK